MSLTLLKDYVLPAAFNKDGTTFVECELDPNSKGEDQFQSAVVFLTAIVKSKNEEKEIPLVVKFEPHDKEMKAFFNTTPQFYNEVFMYGKVLPFLDKNKMIEDTFAKFYYGVGSFDKTIENVVVIEDLKPLGYKLCKEKGFIDYDHLALAMAKLGKFHALSYAAKNESPEEFKRLGTNLKEVTWVKENKWSHVVTACSHRAMDPLIKRGRHTEVLQRYLALVADKNLVLEFMKNLVTPEEPMAVICHGDFCRNNVLFKYNENGKPTDVMFFDIATARLSTPMVDFAFFLFLNSSKEVRRAHLKDLLKIYHDALAYAIPGTVVPSLEDLTEEFHEKAIYGFVHCSFFLPVMLYPNVFADGGVNPSSTEEEIVQIHMSIGGEEATNLLSEMVEELVDLGCLSLHHKFLQVK